MKITCPKCHAAYRIDLPDPGEAGIDVQCGKCLYIFLFTPDIEIPGPSEIQSGTSVKTRDSDLPEDRLSEPILPPQKDEDQEVSSSKKQAPSSLEEDQGTFEESGLKPVSDDPEPLEIVVEDETPDDSLEEGALDDIWNQAMQEGARTGGKSKEKSPIPPSQKAGKSQPLPSQEDPPQEITQEEIDLEEQVTISEGEVMPSWEEAFAHQSEVESGWKKAQEQDRIQDEQQLAEALGKEFVPPSAEETTPSATQEDKQNIVDDIFAEMKTSQESPDQRKEEEPTSPTVEASGEKAESHEKEETPLVQPISGDVDLTADMVDMDMKQLVAQAFQEASQSEEKTGSAEPELTLEMETSTETPAAEQTVPVSQGEEDIAQTIDHYASYVDPPATPEVGPIPELSLESAEEGPDIEPELEMEPMEESAGIPEAEASSAESEIEPIPELTLESAEEESEIAPELELEPELTMESSETTVPTQADSSKNQESLLDEDGKELWTDLFPEQHEGAPPVSEEAPIASNKEEDEGPFEGSDFWDQVLDKESQESQTAETEAEPQPVSPVPVAQDAVERETLTDEELWEQAFPGEEEFEPTAFQYSGEKEDDSKSETAPLVIGANAKLNEELEDSPDYDEAAYADDDDDDEFEFQRRERKLGPFAIPHGRRGDLVIGGAMVVFLLLAGSVYFTLQTFAPDELTDIQTAKTEVPEGLTPREVPLDELAGDLTSPKPPEPEKTPPVDTPGDKGEAILSDPSKILEASPEEKGILKDLAESQILKDTGKTQTAKIDQSALQALTGHSVTMSTIMPVAYNPTDIRVLSFSVEIQLSNAQSAKMVRESLSVYEEIMNQTVEDFLRRKFYNDILYVKEKLQKRLQTAMNKSLKNGRVRKTKFVDFAIQ